ncbi:MAG: stage III sporulation protein AB [Clostridia bacterium]|nr:stage III sporulation protein AB [Clostridia bacterium]
MYLFLKRGAKVIYFVCITIMAASYFAGKEIAKIYVKRDRFFKNLSEFCDFLKSNISFFQTKISEIFDGYIKDYSSEFDNIYKQFQNLIMDENGKSVAEDIKFLKAEDKVTLNNFLKGLGKSDQKNQMMLIDNFKNYALKRSEECASARRSQEGLIFKVSLAVGAVICILII